MYRCECSKIEARKQHGNDKAVEITIVPSSNTVAHPRTVVVKFIWRELDLIALGMLTDQHSYHKYYSVKLLAADISCK